MTSKRKWDQAAPETATDGASTPSKAAKAEDGKTASEAAAAAAAIAAKIAAQYAGAGPAPGALGGGTRDPHDGEFTFDIDINDVRNRYMLTKGPTQQQIHDETGASVSTKGTWYPDRTKASDNDPPLYLHISATTKEVLQKGIDKVNDLLSQELGPLVDDRTGRGRERRKWPEEKIDINLETIRNFNVRAKVVGPQGMFVKYIQQETGTRVQIKGAGSGFVEQETGRESDEPMHIHVTGPDEGQVARGKALADDLLEVVRSEHGKVVQWLQHQQMELHQAQVQYATYSAMAGGYAPPPPSGAPPPPPPGGDAPPPPPPDGSAPPPPPGGAPPAPGGSAPVDGQDPYLQYWAAYGYDVNSAQFKEWYASQQQQQQGAPGGEQYYGQQPANGAAPPPPSDSAPPPPPPPA